jgi:DNA invertase Pin-like site-specific DNA recombinase
MIVGYARTSTTEQVAGFEAQIRDLKAAGCERIFQEQISSVAKREQLDQVLSFIRDGDVLTVTKLDRLARSVADLVKIVETVKTRGASLRILAMQLDTASATGQLMVNVIGAVAQFERQMMLERQREGIEAAKRAGRYVGRQPTAQRKAAAIADLYAQGVAPAEIGRRLGISRASTYRYLPRVPTAA